jgi:hypothetical protein
MRIQLISAACLLSALAFAACGQTDSGSPSATGGTANVATGGAAPSESGASSGGAAAAGRAASGGDTTTTGGVTTTGGATARGGATNTAGASSGGIPGAVQGPLFECTGPEIRACQEDSDCVFVRTYSCCGAGLIYGLGTQFRDQFPDCYKDILPPQNCPPLGCFSSATTEDGQDGSAAVVARCYEIEPGRKECRTTLDDSCVHNVTRCVEGAECSNDCEKPCVCQDGFMVCEKPEVGSPCSQVYQACNYANSPTDGTANTCTCSTEGMWGC